MMKGEIKISPSTCLIQQHGGIGKRHSESEIQGSTLSTEVYPSLF